MAINKSNITNYRQYFLYLIRRILRIYPAHLATLLVIICVISYKDFTIPFNTIYSKWFNFWPRFFNEHELNQNIYLLNYPSYNLNGVTWSLYHEIYASMFLPVFFWINKNYKPWTQVVFLLLLMYCSNAALGNTDSIPLRYTYCFYLGALIFTQRDFINKNLGFLTSKKMLLPTIFLIMPAARFFINSDSAFLIILCETLSSALLVIICAENKNEIFFLDGKFFSFLGKISYSLYIIQMPIIYLTFTSLIKIFPENFVASHSFGLQLITTPFCILFSILAAQLLHKFVEYPCMKLGKKITS